MRRIGQVSGFAQHTNVGVDQTKSTTPTTNRNGKQRSPETPLLVQKSRPWDKKLDRAIEWAYYTALQLPEKVKMLHLVDLFNQKDLDIWNKSPGLPWRDIGYKTKGDIRKDPESITTVCHFWDQVKLNEGLCPPDCFANISSDIADSGEMGVGVVYEYPATMSFGEAVFAIPLINAYQQSNKTIAYGYEKAVGGMEKVAHRFGSYSYCAGLEFQDFNETVPPWLIQIAFDILYTNVYFVDYRSKQKMCPMWNYIVDYFINPTIRTTDGKIFKKNSGIPSDSLFTQIIPSIVNCMLCQWICLDQTGILATEILVQGHKSLIATNTLLQHCKVNNLLESIGIHINKDKSQITKDFATLKISFTE